MPRPRLRATELPAFVCLWLGLAFGPYAAASGPEPEAPIEGPNRPPADAADAGAATGSSNPDNDGGDEPGAATPPHFEPPPPQLEPGIEFAVPEPEPLEELPPAAAFDPLGGMTFPDPGMAPSDGVSMLVLSGTTIALTIAGVSAGLAIGIQREVDLGWLLPSTLVPGVGLLAFSAGGMYLGIKRARAYRRWEIGYRVIGLPQGGGLMIGGSFALLGALGLLPSGVVMLDEQPNVAIPLIAVGAAAAVATPIMFVIGTRNQRRYQRTGGWKRRPIPPLPPGAVTGQLELRPVFLPLRGGASVGVGGRF